MQPFVYEVAIEEGKNLRVVQQHHSIPFLETEISIGSGFVVVKSNKHCCALKRIKVRSQ